MDYSIEKINRSNYIMFDNMVFFRQNKRERNETESMDIKIDDTVYKALEDKNLYIFAAKTSNKFIGWISLIYMPKVGRTNGRGYLYIDELWTNPNYRNKGIAYALMEKGDVISKELNTLGLRLYVNTENNEAISLYQKCGFKNSGNAIFMEK